MAIGTAFTNWQTSKDEPGEAPYNTCAPALLNLRDYLIERWGGKSLGCFHDREIAGTSKPSSHAFGAALDWRYVEPGPGRGVVTNEVIPFLIEWSKELGIQAIHDYVGSRIWRANRSGDENGGWKSQDKEAGGMGQPWAQWLHIEVTKSAWAKNDPVEKKIADGEPDTSKPMRRPTLRRGSRGDAVRELQTMLRRLRYQIAIDGDFGPQTENRVRRFQQGRRLKIDGIVGAKTWSELDKARR